MIHTYNLVTLKDDLKLYKSRDLIKFRCSYCSCIFERPKNRVLSKLKKQQKQLFCSSTCFSDSSIIKVSVSCGFCDTPIIKDKRYCESSKSGYCFCNSSCSASYNNRHKVKGYRRSKFELFIENKLSQMYSFDIRFNDKGIIGSELDIYIPHLSLAFEINGIFHYSPIYGDAKFQRIISNDLEKQLQCISNGISLHVIDISAIHHFTESKGLPYLEEITKIIDSA